jgi:hypothetical protein
MFLDIRHPHAITQLAPRGVLILFEGGEVGGEGLRRVEHETIDFNLVSLLSLCELSSRPSHCSGDKSKLFSMCFNPTPKDLEGFSVRKLYLAIAFRLLECGRLETTARKTLLTDSGVRNIFATSSSMITTNRPSLLLPAKRLGLALL